MSYLPLFEGYSWFVSLCRTHGIFHLTDPSGVTLIRNCRESGFHPHEEPLDGSPIYEHCSHVYINANMKYDVIDLRNSWSYQGVQTHARSSWEETIDATCSLILSMSTTMLAMLLVYSVFTLMRMDICCVVKTPKLQILCLLSVCPATQPVASLVYMQFVTNGSSRIAFYDVSELLYYS